jgi:hypothetical protein
MLLVCSKSVARHLLFILLVVSWNSPAAEPSYAKRPFTAWMDDLSPKNPEKTRQRAKEAIEKMGTDALPFLLKELRALDESSITNYYSTGLETQRFKIFAAFEALGPIAKPAIPQLTDMMRAGGNSSCSAAHALTTVGPEGALSLSSALTNGALPLRVCIAQIVSDAGTNAWITIPALLDCLKYQSSQSNLSVELRGFAAASLGSIGNRPDIVVPALIEALKDDNRGVRFSAARALGRYGKDAQSAISALRAALNDSDSHVRSVAASALRQIQP